jgi:hypothetical protein
MIGVDLIRRIRALDHRKDVAIVLATGTTDCAVVATALAAAPCSAHISSWATRWASDRPRDWPSSSATWILPVGPYGSSGTWRRTGHRADENL